MNGQILLRKTSAKSKSGKDVFILLGVVSLDEHDNFQDGYKYDILDVLANNGKDFTELNNAKSPEDLLEERIWIVK